MAEKLKPCPFCGGAAYSIAKVVRGYASDSIRFAVRCSHCMVERHVEIECSGNFERIESAMNKAVEAWNRRADNDKT